MKFLLWEISIESYKLAKLQWLLFKLFGYKPKAPCGHTKTTYGYYCHQPFDLKHCDVINDGEIHKIVCKCCGCNRMKSNRYINPNDDKEWDKF